MHQPAQRRRGGQIRAVGDLTKQGHVRPERAPVRIDPEFTATGVQPGLKLLERFGRFAPQPEHPRTRKPAKAIQSQLTRLGTDYLRRRLEIGQSPGGLVAQEQKRQMQIVIGYSATRAIEYGPSPADGLTDTDIRP